MKITEKNCVMDVRLYYEIVDKYKFYLSETPLSTNSKNKYLSVARYYLRVLGAECTEEELRTFLYGKKYAPNTFNLYCLSLKAFYKWMKKNGYRKGPNPVKNIMLPRLSRGVPRPMADRELGRALAYAPKRIRLMLLLGAYAGLRASEIANLRVSDLDIEAMMIYVMDGKGGKNRSVPLHPDVLDAFYSYAGTSIGGKGLIFFIDERRSPELNARWVGSELQDFYDKYALDMTTHQLRHWFATHMFKVTKDIVTVSKLLGHSNLSTTMVYAQWDMELGVSGVNGLVGSFDKRAFTEYGKAVTPLSYRRYPKIGERRAELENRARRNKKVLDKLPVIPDIRRLGYELNESDGLDQRRPSAAVIDVDTLT